MDNSMKFPTFAFRISRDTYDRKPTGEEVASEIKKQKATAKTRKQLSQRYETADMDVG